MNQNSPDLQIKLAELEELFATGVTDNRNAYELSKIWSEIKELRHQLNHPVFIDLFPDQESSDYNIIPV